MLNGDLDNFLTAMTPGGIEAQEAAGQRALVKNDELLPLEVRDSYVGDKRVSGKTLFEKAGVVFHDEVVDGIFQRVTLPAGWKKVATDHSMWSKLVDDKGRERASIFYKAAFYDRSAHIGLNCRYGVRQDYDRDEAGEIVFQVRDGETSIFESVLKPTFDRKTDEGRRAWYEAREQPQAEATRWLEAHYPNWQDPSAYWD